MQRRHFSKFLLLPCLIGLFAGSWSSTAQQSGGEDRVSIPGQNVRRTELCDECHALVIAAGNYTNGWDRLTLVDREMKAVSAALVKHGYQVKELLDPTHPQFRDTLVTFITEHGLRERNCLLIYFIGHGETVKVQADGRTLGYIVPVDAPKQEADPSEFNKKAISMDEMETYARRIQSRHVLFVFDSCFSGTIFEAMRGDGPIPPPIRKRDPAPVRFFIAAGTEDQTVPNYGIFRSFFVRALEGEGDLNNDGYVTGEELGQFLYWRVSIESRDTQTPHFGKIKDRRLNQGDFVFELPNRNPSSPHLATVELLEWVKIRNSADPAVFESHLQKYPNGEFANFAKEQLARLKGAQVPGGIEVFPSGSNRKLGSAGVPLRIFSFETVTLDANGKISKSERRQAWEFEEYLGNGVKLELVDLPGGTSSMGSDDAEIQSAYLDAKRTVPGYPIEWFENETPRYTVTVQPFSMGKFEITLAQWREVAKGLYRGGIVPVGSLGKANGFGLFDMFGNVSEWCEDMWHESYAGAPRDGRAWITGGNSEERVLRGGSYTNVAWALRSAARFKKAPSYRFYNLGFRAAVSAKPQ